MGSFAADDDAYDRLEVEQLLYTLWLNVAVFASLMVCFELNRHIKSIYLQRTQHSKYVKSNRVPPIPPPYPFAWIIASLAVTEDQILEMVGLDGYMLVRYVHVCWRICAFITFFGLIVLVPIYATAGEHQFWQTYTIANIPEDDENRKYWAPCIFAYIFSYYFCKLFKEEYENFLEKKLSYLITGDVDTHPQTYLTVMVEKVPSKLRSREELGKFFNGLFPGKVFSVEFALDIKDLDNMTNKRRLTRNMLEKAIALYSATGRRPVVWVPQSFYDTFPNSSVKPLAPSTGLRLLLKQNQYDSIDHYNFYLNHLNNEVEQLQAFYMNRNQREGSVDAPMTYVDTFGRTIFKVTEGFKKRVSNPILAGLLESPEADLDVARHALDEAPDGDYSPLHEPVHEKGTVSSAVSKSGHAVKVALGKTATSVGSTIGAGVGTVAQHGIDNFMSTAEGALTGLRTAGKAIELLTLGAHYKTSSTAFVTFNSRVAMTSAHQMLMSHDYPSLAVKPAPNSREIIWTNIAVPLQQIDARNSVANALLTLGIVYWGAVVAFIATITNLESLSKQSSWNWLAKYKTNYFYTLMNNYLALGLLLILLSLLPVLFQLSLRSYERFKLESDVQNLIMTRYYFYQVANVYVSVGFGSITSSISAILADPSNILRILGYYIASFSTYFAQLVIIKTFTGLPIELMRLWPLIQIFFVKMCRDKKKCTRRELRSGVLYNPEMLYGWVYPNCLMVLMIMCIYCCIAPLIMPIVLTFFTFVYVIYRYQLLFVFINSYQSGGYMWYSVFSRSIFALTAGMTTFCCYLGIRVTFSSAPFYASMPLPIMLILFSQHCERKYKQQSINLSMQQAMSMDRVDEMRSMAGEPCSTSALSPAAFRQPNLSEGRLRPAVYRRTRNSTSAMSFDNAELEQGKSTEFVQRVTTERADPSFYESEDEGDAGDEQAKDLEVDEILAEYPDDTRSSSRTRESASSNVF